MSHAQRQYQIKKANEAAEKIEQGLTPQELQHRGAAGEKRRDAIADTPAGSYRSLRAALNGGDDKAEVRHA